MMTGMNLCKNRSTCETTGKFCVSSLGFSPRLYEKVENREVVRRSRPAGRYNKLRLDPYTASTRFHLLLDCCIFNINLITFLFWMFFVNFLLSFCGWSVYRPGFSLGKTQRKYPAKFQSSLSSAVGLCWMLTFVVNDLRWNLCFWMSAGLQSYVVDGF